MSCKADPDLWLKPEIRPEDEVEYRFYLLCYVDDIFLSTTMTTLFFSV